MMAYAASHDHVFYNKSSKDQLTSHSGILSQGNATITTSPSTSAIDTKIDSNLPFGRDGDKSNNLKVNIPSTTTSLLSGDILSSLKLYKNVKNYHNDPFEKSSELDEDIIKIRALSQCNEETLLNFFENETSCERKKQSEKVSSSYQEKGLKGRCKRVAICGRVKMVNLEKNFGFIRPLKNQSLNADDVKTTDDKDVYFHFDKVRAYLFKLKAGDIVQYSLHENRKKKTFAVNVIVLKLEQRNYMEVFDYLNLLDQEISCSLEDKKLNSNVAKMIGSNIWKHLSETISKFSPDPDCDEIVLKLLDLICKLGNIVETLDESFRQMLSAVTNTAFFNPFSGRLRNIIEETNNRDDLDLLKSFLLLIAKCVPDKTQAVIALTKPIANRGSPETNDFLFKMLQIVSKMTSANIGDMEWDNMPLIMTNDEVHSPLISEHLNLKPVIVKGNYNSPYDYIDTYFRLLRTDCFSSLKKGIKDYIGGKLDERDMNIYVNIVIYGIELGKDSLTLALKVTPPKKIRNWDTSKSLMFGNLLCLSIGGNFKHLIWAIVADRERLKTDNIVMVQSCYEFNSSNDGELIIELLCSGVPIVMAESPSYYRAYQPVLKSLQAMDPADMSFGDEIVYLKGRYSPFYSQDLAFDANLVYRNFADERISIHDYIHNRHDSRNSIFDKSQEKAVKKALTYSIGIIQGPPGTGKSFIGVQMLRIILSMSSSVGKKVLILTYKNHALDEFAKSALQYFPLDIVRIGGRSRDEDMDKISLNNVRRKGNKTYEFYDQINSIKDEIEQLKDDIERDFEELNETICFSYSRIFLQLTPAQQLSIIRDCDWSKMNFPSFGLIDDEGFEMKRKKKGKITKITSEEVAKILKDPSRNGEKIMRLASAAFKQWVPEDGLFKKAAAILTGHADLCIKEEMQDKGKGNKADEKGDDDVDEEERKLLEDERLTIQLKGRGNKRILNIEIPKYDDSISTLSITATKKLLSGDYDHLLCYENLWNLDKIQRVYVIQYIASKERKQVSENFEENVNLFLQKTNELSEIENQITAKMLEDKQIIAMTITGASIHNRLLQQIRPEIVIVEEAAEILEPQLVAAIGSWSEYMLLIGDHCQLRPSVETYELKRDFHFDLSMMERLINNNMAFSTLQMQHRQREEFAELLKDIYPDLKTELSGRNTPAKCLAKSSFFWNHNFLENKERSVTNGKESERAVMLALFLIQQGYKPSQITILAMYEGQTSLIRRCLKEKMQKHENELGIRMTKEDNVIVHTVDMYQGDENDFVIVSLVRSNEQGKIGFLAERNRRCVAQSRAKCGVYFIGNISMFRNHPTWKPMTDKLQNEGRIHDKLEIKCMHHPNMSYLIADITLKTFCNEPCIMRMNCLLHNCDRVCQPPHSHNACKQMVSFIHAICGHRDMKKCMEKPDHKRCESEVTFSFPNCLHMGKKRCFEDISTLVCKFEESVRLPACRHFIKKRCYQNINDLKCQEKCARKMEKCDHPCNHKCFEHESVNHCEDCDKIKKIEAEKLRKFEETRRRQNQKAVKAEIEEIKKKDVVEGEVIREELKSDGATAPEYLDIEDLVKKYVQPTHAWYPRVTKIEKVTNNFLRIKWLHAKRALFDPEGRNVLKFHGTSDEGVAGITKDGFRLPTTGNPMYGFGVYFASDSSKSAQDMYTKGSNKLLLCEVLLGKSLTVEKACCNMTLAELKKKKCDSLFAKRGTREKGGVLYDEFVIFDPSQAYPKYIIHYDASSCHNKSNTQLQFTDTFKTGKMAILPTRGLKMDDPLDIHFRIAESQFLRLINKLGQQNDDVTVKQVEVYMNPILKTRFENKMVEFEKKYGSGKLESEYLLLFHGTKSRCFVEKIMDENFKCSVQGKFGPGVYFSEFPSYTYGYGGRHYMILSKVLPGKIYPAQGSHQLVDGYNSHGGIPRNDTGGTRYSEIVIFDTDQILPCYVIHI